MPLIFTMMIAYLTAGFDKVQNIFAKPDDFVSAPEFQFLLTALIVLIFGPGVFSLDAIMARIRGQKKS